MGKQLFPLRKRFDLMRSLEEWHQYLFIRTGDTLLGMVETGNIGLVNIRLIDDGTYMPLEDEPEFRAALAAIAHRRISQAYTALAAMEPLLKDKPAILAGQEGNGQNRNQHDGAGEEQHRKLR